METQTKPSDKKADARALGDKPQARLEFAQRLRELRVPRGFRTARSLAKALGIDENRYTRYERAEVEPDLALIRRICQVLAVTPTDLLGVGEAIAEAAPAGDSERNGHGDGRGAGGAAGHARDEQPVVGVKQARSVGVDFAAWKLACVAAEAKLGTQQQTDQRGADQTSMQLLAIASPIYHRLRDAPFEAIAELAADRQVLEAPPQISGKVLAAINALVAAIHDQAAVGAK